MGQSKRAVLCTADPSTRGHPAVTNTRCVSEIARGRRDDRAFAEDLAEFSGAGLYDTLPNVKGTDAVVAAIKQVWASLWNFAAYENRQRSGIDHATASGAVLVQVGVDGTAAGVLVTAHPTDPTG
jgi:phosphoenolpyruvate synthase/pyruvate phosphate dikinase